MNDPQFPPVAQANQQGLLAVGGDLDASILLAAYRQGIFPWPLAPDAPVAWFSPHPRGVLVTSDLHVPRSLDKVLRQKKFQVTFNQDFDQVIEQCSVSKRPLEQNCPPGTWITPNMVAAYQGLHRLGHAYSVESWQDGHLVGGLYGVNIGAFFSGESMFFKHRDASKVALVILVKRLRQYQIPWLDTQMVTPVTAALGAKDMAREKFIQELAPLIARPRRVDFFPAPE